MSIMVHVWLLMEFQAYTVSGKVTYHTIVIFLAVLFYCMTDIAYETIWLCSLHTYLKTFFGYTN